MAWIRINLPFTKWANPFTPRRFVFEILSEANLWLTLSRPLILAFGTRPEGELEPEDSLKSCLSEVEAEVGLQIILEPDCTRVVLVNMELLELHQPPLLWLLIELSLSLKKGGKAYSSLQCFQLCWNICFQHLLLGCVDLLSTMEYPWR